MFLNYHDESNSIDLEGACIRGAYNRVYVFCLQVDGPIPGGTNKLGGGGLLSGSLRCPCQLSVEHFWIY